MNDSIRSYMTSSVQIIGIRRTLEEARELMEEQNFRHLPVMEGGKCVGMVSQRDLQLLDTVPDVDPKSMSVEEAMSQDVLTVDPDQPLASVAGQMARRKCGSAVVMRDGEVVGIFTTIDALNALEKLLTEKPVRRAVRRTPAPVAVR